MTTIEHIAGIDSYLTKTSGISGIIRMNADDFRVTEVWDHEQSMKGQYLIVKLTKKDWDTNHLIRELSRWFRVSRSRFGWAGTKDKRAITTQRLSIWDPDHAIEAMIPGVHIPGIELEIIGRSKRKISLGDLHGNEFRIVIRGIDKTEEEVTESIENISDELAHAGGMPNFYGIQRFGTIRPITHEVGRHIVSGDFENAVMVYLAKPFPEDRSSEVRRCLLDTRDFKAALSDFPDHLRYERAMLNHLVKHPDDYTGAVRVLPENLMKMFVHAYQSFIFNKILSFRIKGDIPLNQAIEGDVASFRGENGFPDASRTQIVTPANIDGINNLIRKKRAWVAHSLIGYGSILTSEIESKVISDLEIDIHELIRGFEIAEMPELASRGGYRAIVIDIDPVFDVAAADDTVCVIAEFFLPKGCYATSLLREYMKN
ncbi:MAG: tRNA pseudouridine(13) synthase TruD [Euryarchaeota archaeon]|nr:tRNA pseudouridine(13) synthase TruD [Euryarchaeota archaeon]